MSSNSIEPLVESSVKEELFLYPHTGYLLIRTSKVAQAGIFLSHNLTNLNPLAT
jgi:hypothetical protein